MELSANILLVLFFVALIAGWIDAVAGGGGLITVPALMLAGFSPVTAIATNKLQGTFGTFTAAMYFVRRGMVSINDHFAALMLACLGSVLGGVLLTLVDVTFLNYLVPILLILTGLYFLFFAKNLDDSREPRVSARLFGGSVAPAVGFYDGFFGPGAGSFFATLFVTLRGYTIRKATAHAKLFNFASNIAALAYFVFFGQIAWLAGGVMIGGQMLGAYLGAKTALRAGSKLIRPITVVVCFAMCFRAIWELQTGV